MWNPYKVYFVTPPFQMGISKKQLYTNAEQKLFQQSLQILNEISVQTDEVQADNASVKQVIFDMSDGIERWLNSKRKL